MLIFNSFWVETTALTISHYFILFFIQYQRGDSLLMWVLNKVFILKQELTSLLQISWKAHRLYMAISRLFCVESDFFLTINIFSLIKYHTCVACLISKKKQLLTEVISYVIFLSCWMALLYPWLFYNYQILLHPFFPEWWLKHFNVKTGQGSTSWLIFLTGKCQDLARPLICKSWKKKKNLLSISLMSASPFWQMFWEGTGIIKYFTKLLVKRQTRTMIST